MDDSKKIIKYFGFGSNKDLDMMQHMVGRQDLVGEPGTLIGFELCVIKAKNMRDDVPPGSPADISAREIMVSNWGPDFDMFVSRPNYKAVAHGTIWDLTPQEVELVKEWELVEYGMQEEINALAMDSKGNFVQVETQALMRPPWEIDHVVEGPDYDPWVADKARMLKVADESRENFLKAKQQNPPQS